MEANLDSSLLHWDLNYFTSLSGQRQTSEKPPGGQFRYDHLMHRGSGKINRGPANLGGIMAKWREA